MRKATFFYLLRRGLLTGAGGFIRDGLVMASKFITQGLTHPAQGSAEFDGVSDYIDTGTNTIGIETSSFTISYWAYITNTSWRSVQNRGTGGFGAAAGVQISSTSAYNMSNTAIDDGAGNYIQFASSSYSPNVWQYHTITFDTTTGTGKLYFDGSLFETEINSNLIGVDLTNLNWQIGRANQDVQYIGGNLANVAIWNRALSSDEINSVMFKSYDSLEASEKSGLQAWYSLDDIDGTNVPDSSGNGNNGTAN